jgi:hypothetical protein
MISDMSIRRKIVTYTTNRNPGLEAIAFQLRELTIQWYVVSMHGHHLKCGEIEESKRIEEMSEATGVDLTWRNFVAHSLSGVPPLVVSDTTSF